MKVFIRQLLRQQRGATAVEYGLIIAIIFLGIVGAIGLFADAANRMYDGVASSVSAVM